MIIFVMGLPGSGKSFLASRLAEKINAVHLNSDIVRKDMQKTGKYDPDTKKSVYDELQNRVKQYFYEGQDVVVDATFFKKSFRETFFNLARSLTNEVFYILLEANDEVTYQRVSKKRPDSEAGYEVYLDMKSKFEPPEVGHLKLDTSYADVNELIEKSLKYIGKSHE